MTDGHTDEITTVGFVIDPFRTFQITGTDFTGLDLTELKDALMKHQQAFPGAAYEVLGEAHTTSAAEKEIINVFEAAGVKLLHYWTPVPDIDRNARHGKYPGHLDSLSWMSDYRVSQSFKELIERDQYEKWDDFDDFLWSALCDAVDSPQSVTKLPEPVWVYYTTRLLEWEVGNGGFAQAAMNIPEWFDLAARGNEILGKPELAAFIRKADKLALSEAKRIQKAQAGGLESAFEYFREGTFEEFDRRLDDIGWWSDEERIAYVRANREAFIRLDSVLSGKIHD